MLFTLLVWVVAFAQDGPGTPPANVPPPEDMNAALYTILQWVVGTGASGSAGAGGVGLYFRSRVQALEQRVAATEAAAESAVAEDVVGVLRERVAAVEARASNEAGPLAENAAIAALVARIDSAEATIGRLDSRADDSQTQRATHEALLGRLREDLDGLRQENRDEHQAINGRLADRLDRIAARLIAPP